MFRFQIIVFVVVTFEELSYSVPHLIILTACFYVLLLQYLAVACTVIKACVAGVVVILCIWGSVISGQAVCCCSPTSVVSSWFTAWFINVCLKTANRLAKLS
jgi:uncharacterized membrane protein